MTAIAPNGLEITGTLETITGRARITFHPQDEVDLGDEREGRLRFAWDGETEVFWDEQKTVANEKGQRIFLDEEGNQWTEDDITLEEAASEI